jgi:quinol monooxygenase YgiN
LVVVVVKVYPGVGREDELQARYLKQAEFLRRFEPNASFRLHRSTKEPVTFLWYETYESQAALENHLKVAMPAFRKEFGSTPEGLVARPSDSETYRELVK